MSKKWVMYILFSLVASGVATIGQMDCKEKAEAERQPLIIQHPDGCFLMEPKAIADGMTTGADIVNVSPGRNTFIFDCNGKQIQIEKDVKAGETMWTPTELK